MKLFFREYGSGEPLVILHGLLGMSDNFVSVAKILGRKFRVLLVDQRNHGLSGHDNEFGYEAMSEDLLEFADRLGLQQLFLAGHSMGGKTALRFAYDNPGLVKKLVVVDISPRAYTTATEHEKIIDLMLSVDPSRYSTRRELDQVLSERLNLGWKKQIALKNIIQKPDKTFAWKCNLPAIKNNLEKIMAGVLPNTKFERPTLFISGEKSDYISSADIDLIYEHFTRPVFATIKGAGHLIHAEKPADFVQSIIDFLHGELIP